MSKNNLCTQNWAHKCISGAHFFFSKWFRTDFSVKLNIRPECESRLQSRDFCLKKWNDLTIKRKTAVDKEQTRRNICVCAQKYFSPQSLWCGEAFCARFVHSKKLLTSCLKDNTLSTSLSGFLFFCFLGAVVHWPDQQGRTKSNCYSGDERRFIFFNFFNLATSKDMIVPPV